MSIIRDTLHIDIRHPGLGDNLFYSHLPFIAKRCGFFKYVIVSSFNGFRQGDIKKLVWDANPYVDHVEINKRNFKKYKLSVTDGNLLDQIMLSYGMDDGQRFHEPAVYFSPPERPELSDTIIFDPNYISFVGSISQASVNNIVLNGLGKIAQLPVRVRGYPVPGLPVISSSSLFDYCTIIKSAKKFICLSSGSATLAAALGVPSIVLYGNGQDHIFHHSKIHTYVDVGDYTSIGGFKMVGLKCLNKCRSVFSA